MVARISFGTDVSFESTLQYAARILQDVTKNNSIVPRNNPYLNSVSIVETSELIQIDIAIPFRVEHYLDTNGVDYYTSIKNVSNLVAGDYLQFPIDDITNFSPSAEPPSYIDSLEKHYIWMLTELWRNGNTSTQISIVETPNYDASSRGISLNQINVNYPHILGQVTLNRKSITFLNEPVAERTAKSLRVNTKLKNTFRKKRCIRQQSQIVTYLYGFEKISTKLERSYTLDANATIDEIFAQHNTLGEYVASLNNDGGGGKFLNRSGTLELAEEAAEGVGNIGELPYETYKDMNRDEFVAFVEGNTGKDEVTIGQINLSGDFKAGFDVSPIAATSLDFSGKAAALLEGGSSGGDSEFVDRFANMTGAEIVAEARENTISDVNQFEEAYGVSRIPNDFGLILPDLQGLKNLKLGELNWAEIENGYIDQLNVDLGSHEIRIVPMKGSPMMLPMGSASGIGSGSVPGSGNTQDNPLYATQDPYEDFNPEGRRANETTVKFNGADSLGNLITTNITSRMMGGLMGEIGNLDGLSEAFSELMIKPPNTGFGNPGQGGGMSGGKGSFQGAGLGNTSGTASGQGSKTGGGSAAMLFNYEGSMPRNYVVPNSAFEFPELDIASFEVNIDVGVKADFSQIQVPKLSLDLLRGFIDSTVFGDIKGLMETFADTYLKEEDLGKDVGTSTAKTSNDVSEKKIAAQEALKKTTAANVEENLANSTEEYQQQFNDLQLEYEASLQTYLDLSAQYEEEYENYISGLEDLNISKTLKVNKFDQTDLSLETGLFGTNALTPYLELLGSTIDVYNLHQVANIKARFLDDVDNSGHVMNKISSIWKKESEWVGESTFESRQGWGVNIEKEFRHNITTFSSDHGILKARQVSEVEFELDLVVSQAISLLSDVTSHSIFQSDAGKLIARVAEDLTYSNEFVSLSALGSEVGVTSSTSFTSDHGVLKARTESEFVSTTTFISWQYQESAVEFLRYFFFESIHGILGGRTESELQQTSQFTSNHQISLLSDYQSEFVIESDGVMLRADVDYQTLFQSSVSIFRVADANVEYINTFDSVLELRRADIEYATGFTTLEHTLSRTSTVGSNTTFTSDHGLLRGRTFTDIVYTTDVDNVGVEIHSTANDITSSSVYDSISQYEKVEYNTEWTSTARIHVECTRENEFLSLHIVVRRPLTYVIHEGLSVLADGKHVVIEAVDHEYTNVENQAAFTSTHTPPA